MPGKDLGLPGPHGASQPGQFRDLDAVRPAVEALQGSAGRRHAVGCIDDAEQLLALPGRSDLTSWVTGGQPGLQPRPSPTGQLLCGSQQQLDVKIMATALGAGILLDATVLRALLVPALVALLGRWNWWLPAWAARPLRLPPAAPAPEPQRRTPEAEKSNTTV
jgi:hypothetical protein